ALGLAGTAASRFPPAVAPTFEDRSGRTATVSRGGSSIRPPGPRGLTYRAESKPQGRAPTARHDSTVGGRPAASDPGAPALTAELGPSDPAFPRPGGAGRRAHGRVRGAPSKDPGQGPAARCLLTPGSAHWWNTLELAL